MNVRPQNTSGKTEATTSTSTREAVPGPGNRHIEAATGNQASPASEAAIQSAARHARDMLPPQNLVPRDAAAASSALSSPPGGAQGKAAARGPDISRIGFKPGLNPEETFNKVLKMKRDERPPVADYLSQQYIQDHRQKFASGKAYCIMSTDASVERVQVNGRLGRASGNFVLPEKDFKVLVSKINAEKKRANGDPQKTIETELGFWPGSLKGKEIVYYEVKIKPEEVRIPDGRGKARMIYGFLAVFCPQATPRPSSIRPDCITRAKASW